MTPRPVCGARWRKAAYQITDRAKRYRANAPGCCPPLPRRCEVCRSRRFVVVDDIDGDESNGSPENLRWLCKLCNTKLGSAMAALGSESGLASAIQARARLRNSSSSTALNSRSAGSCRNRGYASK